LGPGLRLKTPVVTIIPNGALVPYRDNTFLPILILTQWKQSMKTGRTERILNNKVRLGRTG